MAVALIALGGPDKGSPENPADSAPLPVRAFLWGIQKNHRDRIPAAKALRTPWDQWAYSKHRQGNTQIQWAREQLRLKRSWW